MELELNGAKNIHKSGLACNYIYILPPDFEILKQWLKSRQSEQEESLINRIRLGKEEVDIVSRNPEFSFFDHKFINDDFEQMYCDVKQHLLSMYSSLSTK